MFKRGLVAAVAAASLVAGPAVAQSSASKLSVAGAVRASAATKGENGLAGLGSGALIGALVFAAAVAAIFVIADEEDGVSN